VSYLCHVEKEALPVQAPVGQRFGAQAAMQGRQSRHLAMMPVFSGRENDRLSLRSDWSARREEAGFEIGSLRLVSMHRRKISSFRAAEDRPHHGQRTRMSACMRPVRRALPDRPWTCSASFSTCTGRTRMPQPIERINRFRRQIPPTSTAPARERQPALRQVDPCAWACRSARANIFPSNIQGLRPGTRCASASGGISAPAAVDLMVG